MRCHMFVTRDPYYNMNAREKYEWVGYTPAMQTFWRNWVSRVTAAVGAIVIAATVAVPAAAQGKIQDRHPAYASEGLTFEQRWDGVREIPLTFEQRWEPVRQLLVRESFREVLKPRAEPVGAPTGSPARPRTVRTTRVAAAVPETPIARPSGEERAICTRHRMRTVWRGRSWNCRR